VTRDSALHAFKCVTLCLLLTAVADSKKLAYGSLSFITIMTGIRCDVMSCHLHPQPHAVIIIINNNINIIAEFLNWPR